MSVVWQFCLDGVGLSIGYILAAQGIVLIYRGSGVVNFAQGGFAAVGAFADYEMQQAGLSAWPALFAGLCFAALAGALTYLLVMRRLTRASQLVQVVGTLGISTIITQSLSWHYGSLGYSGATIVSQQTNIYLFGAHINQYDLVLFLFSVALTAALWAVYKFTAFGLKTSALAENRRAGAALGHSPDRIALLNWTIGGALGGLAGILMAPIIQLSVTSISLLLIPALAAALLGRLTSFWLTMLGGLIVGVGTSELTRYNLGVGWSDAFPFLIVIVILVFRSSTLPARGEVAARLPRIGTGRIRWQLVLPAVAALAAVIIVLPQSGQSAMTMTFAGAILALSLTVVTGYAGQVSLAQVGLAGAGGFVAAKLSGDAGWGFWPSLLAGVFVAFPVGIVVGLPALRARGVSLAIATLGLGLTIQVVFLNNIGLQNNGLGFNIASPSLFGFSLDSSVHPGRYAMLCGALFIVCALAAANLRRGRVGRQLIALRANERAAAALGVNITYAKLYAFVVSAAMAGLAGVLISFQLSPVNFLPGAGFSYDPFTSIALLSLIVVGGLGYIGGSVMAGLLFVGGLGSWATSQLFTSSTAISLIPIIGALGAVFTVLVYQDGAAAEVVAQTKKLVATVSRRFEPDRETPPAPAAPVIRQPPCTLTIENLGVRFGGVIALSDVSLSVSSGKIVGLIGPNGAGKSTLIDAVSGHNRRYAGRIQLDDQSIDGAAASKRARLGIGRSFQSLELFDDLTVEDNLRAASDLPETRHYITDLIAPRRRALPEAAVAAVREFNLENDLQRTPPELPYGKRRLVGIARAIAARPRILLLDEPAAGLDQHECDELATLLKRLASDLGIGILLVEHNVSLVMSVSDHVVALDFGHVIAEGEPSDVRNDPGVVSAYLGKSHDTLRAKHAAEHSRVNPVQSRADA
jgi:ABC-type branched-subunit amino acid transport system ATPase component/branched-subunit amino acid ABC-type transport system permease component